ncbi:MAG: hypothetical protein FWB91_08165 [Defluviitaleaceae bacterium]|nr:hypothetical protein [Defluviitaleaceae bacterium]
MGGFVKGDIVVLNFPFSDLSGTKRRPALVLANLVGKCVERQATNGESNLYLEIYNHGT